MPQGFENKVSNAAGPENEGCRQYHLAANVLCFNALRCDAMQSNLGACPFCSLVASVPALRKHAVPASSAWQHASFQTSSERHLEHLLEPWTVLHFRAQGQKYWQMEKSWEVRCALVCSHRSCVFLGVWLLIRPALLRKHDAYLGRNWKGNVHLLWAEASQSSLRLVCCMSSCQQLLRQALLGERDSRDLPWGLRLGRNMLHLALMRHRPGAQNVTMCHAELGERAPDGRRPGHCEDAAVGGGRRPKK